MPFLALLQRYATARERVHVARTPEEKRAIARFRYQIYGVEQGVAAGADAATEEIWGPVDDHPGTLHFYTGTPERLRGALRVRVWGPGDAPDDVRARYDLDRVPSAEALPGCETSMLMFRRDLRGTAAVPALTAHAARLVVEQHRVQVVFATCSPGHLPAYRRLGLRTYGAPPVRDGYGLLLPLLGLPWDLGHLQAMGSPWHAAMDGLARLGRLPRPETDVLRPFLDEATSVVIDADRVASELQRVLRLARDSPLRALSPATQRRVAERSFVMPVEPGDPVIREGSDDREMFIVLEGRFERRARDRVLDHLGPGDLFGEVALLGSGGRRPATVTALQPGRLLVVRRKLLARLVEREPANAVEIYDAVARQMATRLQAAPPPVRPPALRSSASL